MSERAEAHDSLYIFYSIEIVNDSYSDICQAQGVTIASSTVSLILKIMGLKNSIPVTYSALGSKYKTIIFLLNRFLTNRAIYSLHL